MNLTYKRKSPIAKDSIPFAGTHYPSGLSRYLLRCAIVGVIVGVAMMILSGCNERKTEASPYTRKSPPIVSFCQGIDYTDTAYLHKDKTMEVLMKDIVKLMIRSDSAAIAEGLHIFLNSLHEDDQSLRSSSHYAYLYLGSPSSSVRNESLYLQYLETLLKVPDIPEDLSERSMERLRKTKLNQEGTIANDFDYIDRNGREGSLHHFKANQTMLIFYDPECPHCPEIIERIARNPKVNAAIKSGAMKVLAVYTEGKKDVWESTNDDFPDIWTIAYDQTGILDAELYDIPAMPTVFLLDADKRVLIKDMLW